MLSTFLSTTSTTRFKFFLFRWLCSSPWTAFRCKQHPIYCRVGQLQLVELLWYQGIKDGSPSVLIDLDQGVKPAHSEGAPDWWQLKLCSGHVQRVVGWVVVQVQPLVHWPSARDHKWNVAFGLGWVWHPGLRLIFFKQLSSRSYSASLMIGCEPEQSYHLCRLMLYSWEESTYFMKKITHWYFTKTACAPSAPKNKRMETAFTNNSE